MTLIEKLLTDMAEHGIDRKALEAGINYHEFQYREADYGRYPKGLMLTVCRSWTAGSMMKMNRLWHSRHWTHLHFLRNR